MKIRAGALWRMLLYYPIASAVSGYIILWTSPFYMEKIVDAQGVISATRDPLRAFLVEAGLFLAVFLIGGLVVFRSMTRREIAVSAGILSGIYIAVGLLEKIPGVFSFFLLSDLWLCGSLNSMVTSVIRMVLHQSTIAALLGVFTPMLFTVFGKKEAHPSEQKVQEQ